MKLDILHWYHEKYTKLYYMSMHFNVYTYTISANIFMCDAVRFHHICSLSDGLKWCFTILIYCNVNLYYCCLNSEGDYVRFGWGFYKHILQFSKRQYILHYLFFIIKYFASLRRWPFWHAKWPCIGEVFLPNPLKWVAVTRYTTNLKHTAVQVAIARNITSKNIINRS